MAGERDFKSNPGEGPVAEALKLRPGDDNVA